MFGSVARSLSILLGLAGCNEKAKTPFPAFEEFVVHEDVQRFVDEQLSGLEEADNKADNTPRTVFAEGSSLYGACREFLALIIYKNFLPLTISDPDALNSSDLGALNSSDPDEMIRTACATAESKFSSRGKLDINLTKLSFCEIPVSVFTYIFNYFPQFVSVDLSRSQGLSPRYLASLALEHVKAIKLCRTGLTEMPILYLCQALTNLDLRANRIEVATAAEYHVGRIKMRNPGFDKAVQTVRKDQVQPLEEFFRQKGVVIIDSKLYQDQSELQEIARGVVRLVGEYPTMPNLRYIDLRMNPVHTWRHDMDSVFKNKELLVRLTRYCQDQAVTSRKINSANPVRDSQESSVANAVNPADSTVIPICRRCRGLIWPGSTALTSACRGTCCCGHEDENKQCHEDACDGCSCSFSTAVQPWLRKTLPQFRALNIFCDREYEQLDRCWQPKLCGGSRALS